MVMRLTSKMICRAGEMAQWVQTLDIKLVTLVRTPEPTLKEARTDPRTMSPFLLTHSGVLMQPIYK